MFKNLDLFILLHSNKAHNRQYDFIIMNKDHYSELSTAELIKWIALEQDKQALYELLHNREPVLEDENYYKISDYYFSIFFIAISRLTKLIFINTFFI